MESVQIRSQAVVAGRDELRLELTLEGTEIREAKLRVIGCPAVLSLVQKWRPLLQGALGEVPLPQGQGHAELLLRELLLKAQGKWDFPYKDEELCHCRKVSATRVDEAILDGAHSLAQVTQRTGAGSSCSSCTRDIESLLNFRLKEGK